MPNCRYPFCLGAASCCANQQRAGNQRLRVDLVGPVAPVCTQSAAPVPGVLFSHGCHEADPVDGVLSHTWASVPACSQAALSGNGPI